MDKHATEFRAEILSDGRKRVTVTVLDHPITFFNNKPRSYTTVRNIDGSNRLMNDNGLWDFLPNDYEYAAWSAIAAKEGKVYPWPHCVPNHHHIVA